MIAEIIKNMPMDCDFESDWLPVFNRGIQSGGKSIARALQISWNNAAGTLNGTVSLLVTNDFKSHTIGSSITISSTSNTGDSDMFILYPSFRYIRVKYQKNGITGRSLNAVLSYD